MTDQHLQSERFPDSSSHTPRETEAGKQTKQGQLEISNAPRLYFSTGTRLYELLYQRTEIGYQEGRIRDDPIYHLDFLSSLRELPFHGDSWHQVVADIGEEGGQAAYFHLSPQYDPTDSLGNFRRITHALELPDIQSLVLVRPSHTTQAIAELHKTYGELWHVKALNQHWFEKAASPPEPSKEIQQDMQGNMLYDVFARGRYSSSCVTVGIRLLSDDARRLGETVAVREDGILLYYREDTDALE